METERKRSRIPDQIVAFVQHAVASGADERLDERLTLFLTHAVTKPHLTYRELAPFAGVGTKERAQQLLKEGILKLWQGSPEELQKRYPLADLLQNNRIRKGIPLSPEHSARKSMAEWHSAQSRAEMREAILRGEVQIQQSEARERKGLSPESRAIMSKAMKGKKRKPFSPETRALMSEARREEIRKSWERKK